MTDAPIPPVVWIPTALSGMACALALPRPTACCRACATVRAVGKELSR